MMSLGTAQFCYIGSRIRMGVSTTSRRANCHLGGGKISPLLEVLSGKERLESRGRLEDNGESGESQTLTARNFRALRA